MLTVAFCQTHSSYFMTSPKEFNSILQMQKFKSIGHREHLHAHSTSNILEDFTYNLFDPISKVSAAGESTKKNEERNYGILNIMRKTSITNNSNIK